MPHFKQLIILPICIVIAACAVQIDDNSGLDESNLKETVVVGDIQNGQYLDQLLDNTDCEYVMADRAFGLRVMDWNFPMPAGYDFHGFEYLSDDGRLLFRKDSTVDPLKYIQDHPGTSVEEAVRKKMEQIANIYYYEEDAAENLEGEEYTGFELLEWNGLSLLYRATTSHQRKITVYQVVVRFDDRRERLSLSSTSIEQLTKVIACAEKVV